MSSFYRSLRPIMFSLLLFLVFQCDLSPEDNNPKPITVFFVGSNYTKYHDMPELIGILADANRDVPILQIEDGSLPNADLILLSENDNIGMKILADNYDYVIIQEKSTISLSDLDSFYEGAQKLCYFSERGGSDVLLFMNPAYKGTPGMQDALNEVYQIVADSLGIGLAPVGPAWQRAYDGRPGLNLHENDGSHPNKKGAYLTACLFYAIFYDKSPVGLTNQIVVDNSYEILAPSGDALYLQQCAWDTYLEWFKD